MNNPHPAVVAAAKVAAASCFINRKEPDMSLSNGNAKENRNSLSAAQMFTAAKHLEAEKESIVNNRLTLDELAKFLSERTGVNLTKHNAKNIKEMTGIQWKPKITRRSNGGRLARHDLKELAAAILQISAALGEGLRNQKEVEAIAASD
jgi:hypothetical protein